MIRKVMNRAIRTARAVSLPRSGCTTEPGVAQRTPGKRAHPKAVYREAVAQGGALGCATASR
jgi:hypothetical protein